MKFRKGAIKEMFVLLMIILGVIAFGPGIYAEHRERLEQLEQDDISAWNVMRRPDPPCPYPKDNVHWKSPGDWRKWCSVSAYIKEANPKLSYKERTDMADAIVEWAEKYRMPLGLIVAVCHVESNFNAKAIGPKTKYGQARGAMQVMWPVHQGLAESCSLSPDDVLTANGGVQLGTYLLQRYIDAEGSVSGGLAKYFSKPSRNYIIEKVMSSYLTFDRLHSGRIRTGNISCSHQNEATKLRKIVRGQ